MYQFLMQLFLCTVSWRNNRDFYIMSYIINMMKKHWTHLYHVSIYDTEKVPIGTCLAQSVSSTWAPASLIFGPTKQPYSKVGNSRMSWYGNAVFTSNFTRN